MAPRGSTPGRRSKSRCWGPLLGIADGVVLGIVLANFKNTAKLADPYLLGAYSLPRVALAPFFVLWFGIGLEPTVLLVASIAFFPILFNVRRGMESIDRDLIDASRSTRAGTVPMLTQVVIPGRDALLIMAVIAMVMHFVITLLERVLFRWRSDSGSSAVVPM